MAQRMLLNFPFFRNSTGHMRCFRKFTTVGQDQTSSSSDDEKPPGSDQGKEEGSDDLKERILEASLQFVSTDGWTVQTIAKGAESIGLSPSIHGVFESGGVDLAHYFYRRSNRKLVDHMKQFVTVNKGVVSRSQPLNQFIEGALETRLRMITPYLDKWPQAIGLMSLPPNVPTSLRCLQQLVDDIWFYAGDTSTDFNWYTKRLTLAAVYKSTELCLVQDRSDDYMDTWTFLQRRMNDLSTFSKTVRQMQQISSTGSDVMQATMTTAQSILGVGGNNR